MKYKYRYDIENTYRLPFKPNFEATCHNELYSSISVVFYWKKSEPPMESTGASRSTLGPRLVFHERSSRPFRVVALSHSVSQLVFTSFSIIQSVLFDLFSSIKSNVNTHRRMFFNVIVIILQYTSKTFR